MKPQRFEIGQAVTLNVKNLWNSNGEKECPIKFGDVYKVRGYMPTLKNGIWYIYLEEIPGRMAFGEPYFDPVVNDGHLEKEIEEIFAPLYELV